MKHFNKFQLTTLSLLVITTAGVGIGNWYYKYAEWKTKNSPKVRLISPVRIDILQESNNHIENIIKMTNGDGKVMLEVKEDGKAIVENGFTVDETAAQFWYALANKYSAICDARRTNESQN